MNNMSSKFNCTEKELEEYSLLQGIENGYTIEKKDNYIKMFIEEVELSYSNESKINYSGRCSTNYNIEGTHTNIHNLKIITSKNILLMSLIAFKQLTTNDYDIDLILSSFIQTNKFHYILYLIKFGKNLLVTNEALWIIANIACSTNSNYIQFLLDQDININILELLHTTAKNNKTNEYILENCVWIIGNIALDKREKLIYDNGLFNLIIEILIDSSDDFTNFNEVKDICYWAINCCFDYKNKKEMCQDENLIKSLLLNLVKKVTNKEIMKNLKYDSVYYIFMIILKYSEVNDMYLEEFKNNEEFIRVLIEILNNNENNQLLKPTLRIFGNLTNILNITHINFIIKKYGLINILKRKILNKDLNKNNYYLM